MIIVNYFVPGGGVTWHEREFANDVQPKILQSGVLKMVVPLVTDIPVMGTQAGGYDKMAETEDIVKTPEKVIAVFSGNYFMERVDDDKS